MPPEYNLSGGEGIDEEHVPSAKNIAHHRQAISSRSMQYSMDMLHNRMIYKRRQAMSKKATANSIPTQTTPTQAAHCARGELREPSRCV